MSASESLLKEFVNRYQREEMTVIATKPTSNFGGLSLLEIVDEGMYSYVCGYESHGSEPVLFCCRLNGDTFVLDGEEHSLSEFIKV